MLMAARALQNLHEEAAHCRKDKAAAAQTTRAETASFWGRLFGSGQ